MKKLKKLSLSKKSIAKLEDFEMQKIEGGGGSIPDLVSCYLCSELDKCPVPPTTKPPTPVSMQGPNDTCERCEA